MQIRSFLRYNKQVIRLISSLILCFPLYADTTILLDPSCNTRSVATEYENNVAFLYCQSLQDYCTQNHPNLIIELTRSGHERLEKYAAANFSNKLQPDLHISLQFTSTKRTPTVAIYYFTWGNPTQNKTTLPIPTSSSLSFASASSAYQEHLEESKTYAYSCYQLLNQRYGQSIIIQKPVGCPFKPLTGIIAPAVALEFDLENLENSEIFQEMLLDVIEHIPAQRDTI